MSQKETTLATRGIACRQTFLLRCGLWVFMLMMSACSGLFYYPDQYNYARRDQMKFQPEEVEIETEDHMHLSAWYFHSNEAKPKATILFFHGNAQNKSSHFFHLYWLLEQGYDFLIFDYRGYGGSEGRPSPKGTVLDGYAALRWINAHKRGNSPLIVFGQSLGGAVALRAVADMENEIPVQAVVVDSTFYSYQKIGQKVMSRMWLTWPFQFLAYVLLSDEWAPEYSIAKISPRPLLVVHGDRDKTVDFTLGKKIYDLAKEPKEFWQIKDGSHTDFLFREQMRYQPQFLQWLDRISSNSDRATEK